MHRQSVRSDYRVVATAGHALVVSAFVLIALVAIALVVIALVAIALVVIALVAIALVAIALVDRTPSIAVLLSMSQTNSDS